MLVDRVRAFMPFVLAGMLTACVGGPGTWRFAASESSQRSIPSASSLYAALELMAQAHAASGEDWARLHLSLATSAATNPTHRSRARLALALSQGQRSVEELERGLALMNELLQAFDRPGVQPDDAQALAPEFRQLIRVQRMQLAQRLEAQHEVSMLERTIAGIRAQFVQEADRHAVTKHALHEAEGELHAARAQLRAVTLIERKHESSGG